MSLINIFLKMIPYVLSVSGGIVVFDISKKYLHDPGWIDLADNVAASLLAIPLVFLFYDYSNFLVNRRVHKHQHTSIVNTVDGYLFKVLTQMKNIIGLKHIEVPIQDLNLNYKKLNLDKKYIRAIRKQLNLLEDLLYKSDKIEVLDPQHTQVLSFITQELNQILNEYKFHNSPREIARYLETSMAMIDDWFFATGYTTRKKLGTYKE
ncbi:MAG: hypothetical protein J6S57_01790 [Alphaproteobacteria bacterium]|nr:hypothetical protein [Alphaproteobacteria bacterium]